MSRHLLIAVSLLLAHNAWSSGQEVGNGGDIIVCRKSASNDLEGYYSLDYVLTLSAPAPEQAASLSASLERIAGLLRQKVPELYLSFQAFQKDVFNTSYARAHVWEPAPFGLKQIDDQNIAVQLPENCLKDGKIDLIQAVIRLNPDYSGSETQIFKYMPSALDQLAKDRALQSSFLMVHEWLWELSKNVDRNRRVDRYLHSQAFATASPEQAVQELKGMGLPLTGDQYAFDSVQASVRAAPAGGTVWLVKPEYIEKVTIERPIHIRSLQPEARSLLKGELTIFSGQVELQDFDILTSGIGIWAKNSSGLVIRDLRISSYYSTDTDGIGIELQGSDGSVSGCTFEGLNFGVMLEGAASATIRQNTFKRSKYGISVIDRAAAQILDDNFDSGGTAIRLSSTNVIPAVNKISGNKIRAFDTAMELDDASASIAGNQIANSAEGISVSGNSFVGIAWKNQFSNNQSGVVDRTTAGQVAVQDNLFEKNKRAIVRSSRTTIDANVFSENGEDIASE